MLPVYPNLQSAKNAHYPEPDYTHPDEMPIEEEIKFDEPNME